MSDTPIDRNARGRYEVPGRRNIEIDLGDNDPTQYAVVQKDIDPNIPTSFNGIQIEWFNTFGIRRRRRGKNLGDYANIPYTIFMDALPAGKRLFAYYGGAIHELSFQTEAGQTRASLSVGDPPIGYGP